MTVKMIVPILLITITYIDLSLICHGDPIFSNICLKIIS